MEDAIWQKKIKKETQLAHIDWMIDVIQTELKEDENGLTTPCQNRIISLQYFEHSTTLDPRVTKKRMSKKHLEENS